MKKLKSVEKLRQVVLDYKKSKNLAKPLLIWFNANNHLDDFKKTILSDNTKSPIKRATLIFYLYNFLEKS